MATPYKSQQAPPAPAADPQPVYLVVSHDYGQGGDDADVVGLRAVTLDLAAARSAMRECTIWAADCCRCFTFELLECSSEFTGTEPLGPGLSLRLFENRANGEGLRVLEVRTCLDNFR